VVPDPSSSAPLVISLLQTNEGASLRSGEEGELIGRVLMGTNDYCRGVLGLGGGLESDDDRVLSPGMSKLPHGDVSIRLGGDLPVSPASTIVQRTHLLDGLIQEMLRLLSGL
jgi:hypothetical protein